MFRGDDVKDQNGEVAMFQEMATTPIAPEASRYSVLSACFLGHNVEERAVQQACLQAATEGTPTYVVSPPELWTLEMTKMKRPVFRLRTALEGH